MTEQLEQIPIAAAQALLQDGNSDVAFYLPSEAGKSPVLYREAATDLAQPDFDRLEQYGVSALFVRARDLDRCERVLEAQLSDVLGNPDIDAAQKARCVQHVGTSVASALLSDPAGTGQVDRAASVLDTVIEGLLADTSVAADLLHMASHHQATASHMFSVSILSIMLGSEVIGPEPDRLRELGLAGLLHDLGKTTIPLEILNKVGPLTAAEVKELQQHPVRSIALIGDNPTVSPSVRQMILQHHERVDGQGYPLGLTGDELLVGSKILTIADTYHAMIGRRAYREPITPAEASRILAAQVGKQFCPEVFAHWKAVVDRCSANQNLASAIRQSESSAEEPGKSSPMEHRRVRRSDARRARPPRLQCEGRVAVRCRYAGRLVDATCAPDEFASALHDVSKNGLCMYTSAPMYRGEIVHVLLSSASESVWVRGVVAWCRRQPGVPRYRAGVQFVERIAEGQVNERLEALSLEMILE